VRARIAVLAMTMAVLAAGCTEGLREGTRALGTPSISASASASASTSPSPTPSPSPTASGPGKGKPIVVQSPVEGDQILSPVVVRGEAESASGAVAVRILDAEGNELVAMNADVSCGASCRGVFRAALAFFVQAEQDGTVQVWEPGSGGMAKHLVEVPVVLVPGV
jgi:hypothetical protein